jgi:hypothetical protein
MSSGRRTSEQQASYVRQATILRKNLLEWDRMLRTPRGEDWPTMLGRLNAALNQTTNLDRSIDDVMEHFVYVPKQATANAQDIPFFLSTRLELPIDVEQTEHTDSQSELELASNADGNFEGDPVKQLHEYEKNADKLVALYEENMVRY